MGIDNQQKIICHLCLHGPYNEGWNYQENILPKYHVKLGYKVFQIVTPYLWEGTKIAISSDKYYISPDGVEIFRCGLSKGPSFGGRLTHYHEVYNLLESISPDILFIHDVQCLDIASVVKYLKEHKNCVTYVDNHADFSNSASNWLSKYVLHKIIWRHYAKMIEPYTKKFYGVLPARVDFLVDVYKLPKEKVELLVMGADDELVEKAKTPEVRQSLRKKYGIAPDDFLIMTGGKIDLAKRQTLLLMQAVQSIPSERVKLIVFGSVVDELKEEIARLSDGAKVQYIGWIDAHDTYNHFAMADLVVFPCLHSVFWEQVVGLGLPALFNRIDGFDHVDLGGNCIFIDGNDENDIREKIYYLVNNSQVLQEMKNVAEEKGMNSFSYARIAKHSLS